MGRQDEATTPDSGTRAKKVGKGYRPEGTGFYGPSGPTGGTRPGGQTPAPAPPPQQGSDTNKSD